ncbi:MAG: hypothetical protein ACR2PL_08310, partial [Dehalococcoidia bacterium]
LQAAHATGQDLYSRCRQQLVDTPAIFLPPESTPVDGLANWLDTLEMTIRQGRLQAAAVGLSRWLEAAEPALAAAKQAADANGTLLSARDELLGRLSARRAQAQA